MLKITPIEEEDTLPVITPIHAEEEKTGDGSLMLDFAKNIGRVYPVADVATNTIYNMLVTFPAQIGGFLAGGAQKPATNAEHFELLQGILDTEKDYSPAKWNIDNARDTFHKVGNFLGAQPITQHGRELQSQIFDPLEHGAVKAGQFMTDVTDSPLIGAVTYSTVQMLPFIATGGAVRSYMKARAPIKGPFPVEDLVIRTKSDLISEFKNAYRNQDTATMDTLRGLTEQYSWVNAGDMVEGTVIKLGDGIPRDLVPYRAAPEQAPLDLRFMPKPKPKPTEVRSATEAAEVAENLTSADVIELIKLRDNLLEQSARLRKAGKSNEAMPIALEAQRINEVLSNTKENVFKARNDTTERIKQAGPDELYTEKSTFEDYLTEDSNSSIYDRVIEEEILHRNDKSWSKSGLIDAATKKHLNYKDRVTADGRAEITISDDFFNTYTFDSLKSATEFVKKYKKNFAQSEKLWYELWDKERQVAEEFVPGLK